MIDTGSSDKVDRGATEGGAEAYDLYADQADRQSNEGLRSKWNPYDLVRDLPEYQQNILSFYEQWYAENPSQIMKYRTFETTTLISMLDIHRGGLVVDIGFGNIPFMLELAKSGFTVKGENFCSKALELAHKQAPELTLMRCALPKIISNGASAIVARHCLYHLSPVDIGNLAVCVEESLLPGGHFFFMHDLDPMVDPNPHINFFHTAPEILDMIAARSRLNHRFLNQVNEVVHLGDEILGAGPVWMCCFEKPR